jgi:hypothetical protein
VNPSLKHVLSVIRLSGHDSDVFFKLKGFMLNQLCKPYCTDKQMRDVKKVNVILLMIRQRYARPSALMSLICLCLWCGDGMRSPVLCCAVLCPLPYSA